MILVFYFHPAFHFRSCFQCLCENFIYIIYIKTKLDRGSSDCLRTKVSPLFVLFCEHYF